MPVSARTLQALMAAGVAGEQLVQIVALIDADMSPPKDAAAERRRAYDRERKRNSGGNSTGAEKANSTGNSTGIPPENPSLARVRDNPSRLGIPGKNLRTLPSEAKGARGISASVAGQFSEFWLAYPKRKARQAAERAFAKAITKVSLQVMLAKVAELREFDDDWRRGYAPHPATWLNADGWHDEPDGPKAAPVTGGMVAAASDELAVRSLKAKFEREEREREIRNSGRNQSVVVALPEAPARGGGPVSLARGFR